MGELGGSGSGTETVSKRPAWECLTHTRRIETGNAGGAHRLIPSGCGVAISKHRIQYAEEVLSWGDWNGRQPCGYDIGVGSHGSPEYHLRVSRSLGTMKLEPRCRALARSGPEVGRESPEVTPRRWIRDRM